MATVTDKKLEEIYEAFRSALEKKVGREIYVLKIPVDKLNVKVGDDTKARHILDVFKDKYGLDLDGLRKRGWTTGRGPFPKTFYLIPPSKVGERKGKATTNKAADIAL